MLRLSCNLAAKFGTYSKGNHCLNGAIALLVRLDYAD